MQMEDSQLWLMGGKITKAKSGRLVTKRHQMARWSQSCLTLYFQLPESHTSSECELGNFTGCDTSFLRYEK
jgi:hypothetical protein